MGHLANTAVSPYTARCTPCAGAALSAMPATNHLQPSTFHLHMHSSAWARHATDAPSTAWRVTWLVSAFMCTRYAPLLLLLQPKRRLPLAFTALGTCASNCGGTVYRFLPFRALVLNNAPARRSIAFIHQRAAAGTTSFS